MLRLARVTKQRAQQPAVAAEDLQFEMKNGSKLGLQVQVSRLKCCLQPRGVLVADGIVIFLYDRFFAGKVVISGTQGYAGLLGDVPHGCRFQATLTAQGQGRIEYLGAGFSGMFAGDLGIEHVQIIPGRVLVVKSYVNAFIYITMSCRISSLGEQSKFIPLSMGSTLGPSTRLPSRGIAGTWSASAGAGV